MKFDLEYTELSPLTDFEIDIYEGDLDYLNAYLRVIEDALDATGNVTFVFDCLGENWNVYIWGDLCVFCEHLVGLYDFCTIETKEVFMLDFYEQGTERKLEFSTYEGYVLKISNKTKGWEAPSDGELMSKHVLAKEIRIFVNKIKQAVAIVWPPLNKLEMIQQWYAHFEKDGFNEKQ
jgi:hypothetical protein